MADNTELASGSGGDTIATDDIGGVKYPRSKIVIGADGTNDGDVSATNPIPAKVTGAAAENAAVSGNPVLIGGRYDATPRTLGDGDVGAPALDADGALQISDGGNTITVDGTVNAVVTNAGTFAVQAAQSGTWTVDLGATDNAVLDAIAASLAGTLTVGSHAVTNAGTFAVQVDGNALTALQLIDDPIYVDDADWTATTSKHTLTGGVYQSTPGTITDGDTGPFRVNANGALHVSIQEGGGAGGTSSTDDGAFTAGSGAGTPAMGFFSSDTVDAGDVGVLAMDASRRLMVSIEADNVGIGGGTQYTEDAAAPANPVGNAMMAERDDALGGLTPVEGDWTHLFTNANGALWVKHDGALPITDNSGSITVDNGGTFAVQAAQSGTWNVTNISGTVSLPTGASTAAKQPALGTAGSASADVITIQGVASMTAVAVSDNGGSLTVDNGGTFAVQVSSALPAGTNAIGKLSANSGVDIGDVDVTSIAAGTNLIGDVGIQGRTTGGLSIYYDNDLDETAVAVKGSAGTLYAIHAINLTAAPLYLQLFNVAQGSVTVGTTTPTVQFVIPANADSDGAGFTLAVPQGIAFGTAITAAASTNSEGNGAPTGNACNVNLFYK